MTELLLRIFFKNDTPLDKDDNVRHRCGFFAGIVGIVTNLILVIIKITIGLSASSVAVIAEGLNNLGDAASSVVTLVGFKLAGKAADAEHPFGHERIEYIAGLIISLLILLVGLNLAGQSFAKIIKPAPSEFTAVTVTIFGLSLFIKIWQGVFYHKTAQKIESVTLEAAAQDAFNDCISTVVVLVSSIIMMIFPQWSLDGYAGVIVSVFIIKTGIDLIKQTADPLIGSLPPQDLADEIIAAATQNPKILGYHDLMIHCYGRSRMFATVHLEFDYREDILQIHDIADNAEYEVKRRTGVNLVVHLDPIDTTDPETLRLKEQVGTIVSQIEEVISFHDFRVVRGPTHTNVLFDLVVSPQTHGNPEKKKQIKDYLTKQIQLIDPHYHVIIKTDVNIVYKK